MFAPGRVSVMQISWMTSQLAQSRTVYLLTGNATPSTSAISRSCSLSCQLHLQVHHLSMPHQLELNSPLYLYTSWDWSFFKCFYLATYIFGCKHETYPQFYPAVFDQTNITIWRMLPISIWWVFSSSCLQCKYFRPFKRPVTWLEFQFKLYFDCADVQLLMSSGLETEPPISSSLLEEEETCSHGNGQSQADSIGSSANGPQVGTGQHGEDRKGSTAEPEVALKTWTGQSSMNSDAGMGVKFNNL